MAFTTDLYRKLNMYTITGKETQWEKKQSRNRPDMWKAYEETEHSQEDNTSR